MLRLLATALLVLVSMVSVTSVAAKDAAVCGDVEDYFRELDKLMFDDMKEFFIDEEWMKDMERMSRKADASESGLLTLTTEEMQPFIDIITIPGDVLLDYPEDDIPAVATAFHESSMSYWLIMPAMMRSIGTGGAFAAMAFVEDLETSSVENAEALEELTATCPSLISRLSTAGDDFGLDGLMVNGELDTEAIDDMGAPEGFAFSLMILPAEEAEEAEE